MATDEAHPIPFVCAVCGGPMEMIVERELPLGGSEGVTHCPRCAARAKVLDDLMAESAEMKRLGTQRDGRLTPC
jgi:hypothetical protein